MDENRVALPSSTLLGAAEPLLRGRFSFQDEVPGRGRAWPRHGGRRRRHPGRSRLCPYQAIVVSAASPPVPAPLVKQLASGPLVHPVGPGGPEPAPALLPHGCAGRRSRKPAVNVRAAIPRNEGRPAPRFPSATVRR